MVELQLLYDIQLELWDRGSNEKNRTTLGTIEIANAEFRAPVQVGEKIIFGRDSSEKFVLYAKVTSSVEHFPNSFQSPRIEAEASVFRDDALAIADVLSRYNWKPKYKQYANILHPYAKE